PVGGNGDRLHRGALCTVDDPTDFSGRPDVCRLRPDHHRSSAEFRFLHVLFHAIRDANDAVVRRILPDRSDPRPAAHPRRTAPAQPRRATRPSATARRTPAGRRDPPRRTDRLLHWWIMAGDGADTTALADLIRRIDL